MLGLFQNQITLVPVSLIQVANKVVAIAKEKDTGADIYWQRGKHSL